MCLANSSTQWTLHQDPHVHQRRMIQDFKKKKRLQWNSVSLSCLLPTWGTGSSTRWRPDLFICDQVLQKMDAQKKNSIESNIRPYWKARSELTVDRNNLLLHGKCIVVPKSLQQQMLEKIHMGHQGIQRCRLCANTSVWWPGLSPEVENVIKQCPTCARDYSEKRTNDLNRTAGVSMVESWYRFVPF